jgi:hypothetical protein
MLRVAVELPAEFATAGEFLADVRAYEAAGAEAVWVAPPGPDRLTLLAAVAVVTSRPRLGAILRSGEAPSDEVLVALDRLSGGRVVLARDARELLLGPDGSERWPRVPAPTGRAAWRELHETHAAAGATGLVVAHAPNLLDILRNPEEDDRGDLAMAVG